MEHLMGLVAASHRAMIKKHLKRAAYLAKGRHFQKKVNLLSWGRTRMQIILSRSFFLGVLISSQYWHLFLPEKKHSLLSEPLRFIFMGDPLGQDKPRQSLGLEALGLPSAAPLEPKVSFWHKLPSYMECKLYILCINIF